MKYLKQFETTAAYNAAKPNLILPNVSLITETHRVEYNPYVEPIIETNLVAKFNITNTSNPTRIAYETSGFNAVEIDDVVQQTVESFHTFNTIGEHTVKYSLKNPNIIGDNAFKECVALKNVIIPDNVTSIGTNAFYNCTSLTSCTIGSSVTTIGGGAFWLCNFRNIDIPNSVTSIGNSAFSYCSELRDIEIPSGITNINTYTFYKCIKLTSVTISDSVTSINGSAFANCESLRNINIPDSVTNIGDSAFWECSALTNVNIGSGVTNIDTTAFYNCSSLTSITCSALNAPSIIYTTFDGVHSNGTLYVPIGSSGYNTWMGTGDSYLGKYNWTKVEQ